MPRVGEAIGEVCRELRLSRFLRGRLLGADHRDPVHLRVRNRHRRDLMEQQRLGSGSALARFSLNVIHSAPILFNHKKE